MPLILIIAPLVATAAVFAAPPLPVEAAGPKVVIVVGPSHGSTVAVHPAGSGDRGQARKYGARVTQIYTPYATWSRVRKAARGANVFIYLGHGYGHPSPYGRLNPARMNGMGLNPVRGRGRTQPVKYVGEAQIARGIRFARGSVVILHHLCYASGNGEPGMREPGWAVARKRVDNFAAGFLRVRARARSWPMRTATSRTSCAWSSRTAATS